MVLWEACYYIFVIHSGIAQWKVKYTLCLLCLQRCIRAILKWEQLVDKEEKPFIGKFSAAEPVGFYSVFTGWALLLGCNAGFLPYSHFVMVIISGREKVRPGEQFLAFVLGVS